jgi:hypothetical protein
MLRFVVCASLSLIASSFTAAQDWVGFLQTEKYRDEIDISSLARHPLGVKFWSRTNFTEAQVSSTLHPTKFTRQTYFSIIFLQVVSCPDRTIGGLQRIEYSDNNGGGDTVSSLALTKPAMSDVVPGSIGAKMLTDVCALARQRKLVL